MELYLIRHSKTAANAEGRYMGKTDVPISEQGAEMARAGGVFEGVDEVFVSPMLRARQTAAILFPNATQRVVDDLREMDFGDFEGRTADEMAQDADYGAWVQGGGLGVCPGGESFGDVARRTGDALAAILRQAKQDGASRVITVTHGGVIMALMARFAVPGSDPFAYYAKNCGGYRVELDDGFFGPGGAFSSFDKLEKLDL